LFAYKKQTIDGVECDLGLKQRVAFIDIDGPPVDQDGRPRSSSIA